MMAWQTPRAGHSSSCDEPHFSQFTSHHPRNQQTPRETSSQLHHRRTRNSPSPRKSSPNLKLLRLPSHIILLSFTILLSCLAPIASASTMYIPEQLVETPKELAPSAPLRAEDPRTALERLAEGPILVDTSPPPKPGNEWMLASLADDMKRKKRQVGGDEETSTTSTKPKTTEKATSTEKPSSTSTQPPSSTASIETAEETGSRPLPTIFDNGFNGNLTDSCQQFMNDMLRDAVFKACLPFSLLLQNSNSFFQTTKSVTLTTRLLDYTCAANITICAPLLSNLATNLTSTSTCGTDLANGNPQIAQAQLGLLSFKPLYTASCLRNSRTSSYCFADAVTNKTSPADGYVYYLPLNMTIPPDENLTCSQCLQDTMAVFSGSDGGSTGKSKSANEALAYTYVDAAVHVNKACGPTFVNTTLAMPVSAAFKSSMPSLGMGAFALLAVVGSWLL